MMKRPKVIVLRSAGTNCDQETKFAFELAGAEADLLHINEIMQGHRRLSSYEILALPGGFTYGDDLGAGKIFANEIRFKLQDQLARFLNDGKLIIGICNGFQILVKSGLLPGAAAFSQEASLILNDSAKFEDRWIYLSTKGCCGAEGLKPRCVWAASLPEIIYLPVAHGEGKFVVGKQETVQTVRDNNQIVFRYCNRHGSSDAYPHNPNGSVFDIAGICDTTGRVLGMMPHPERHMFFTQHPHWMRLAKRSEGDGLQIFRNGVEYAKKHL